MRISKLSSDMQALICNVINNAVAAGKTVEILFGDNTCTRIAGAFPHTTYGVFCIAQVLNCGSVSVVSLRPGTVVRAFLGMEGPSEILFEYPGEATADSSTAPAKAFVSESTETDKEELNLKTIREELTGIKKDMAAMEGGIRRIINVLECIRYR